MCPRLILTYTIYIICCLLTYKVLNNNGPPCFKDLTVQYHPIRALGSLLLRSGLKLSVLVKHIVRAGSG